MKRQIILVICVITFSFNVFSQTKKVIEKNPTDAIKNCIIHSIPLYRTKDIRNFILTLNGKEEFCNAFMEDVIETGKKEGVNIKGIYRGNLIEFSYQYPFMKINYQLWLDEELTQGASDVQYYSASGKLILDAWFMPKHRISSFPIKHLDSLDDFCSHAELVAKMMTKSMYIPHQLSVRLSLNLNNSKLYLKSFEKILEENELLVDCIYSKDNYDYLTADNGKHCYEIISFVNKRLPLEGKAEPTYEVTPFW